MKNWLEMKTICLIALFAVIAIQGTVKYGYAQAPGTSTATLGAASTYNVYVLTTDTANGTAQGNTAVAGNATFTNYTAGTGLNQGSSTNSIVVGGTLNGNSTATNGSVYANNLNWSDPTIYGNATGNTVSLTNGGTVAGNITYGSTYSNQNTVVSNSNLGIVTSPINFNTTNSALSNDSTYWATNLTANGTVNNNGYGGITLTGSNPTTDVFSLDGTTLNDTELNINAPTGATVLVNISGSNINWSGYSMSLSGGISASNVLLNFSNATNLSISNMAIYGTILAPNAATTINGGNINGGLIVSSFSGNVTAVTGGGYTDLFGGSLAQAPSPTTVAAVPEPNTLTVFTFGLLALSGLTFVRRTKTALNH